MKDRLLVFSLCLCAVLLGVIVFRPALPAAQAQGPGSGVGRYQMAIQQREGGGYPAVVYVTDTTDGRVWQYISVAKKWSSIGAPK